MIETDRKPVQAVGIFDFAKQVEEMILNGWRFNFEDNDLAPVNYGMMIYCIMEKPVKKSNMGEMTIQATGTVDKVATETVVATSLETNVSTNAETVADTETVTDVKADATAEDTQTETKKRGRPKAQ